MANISDRSIWSFRDDMLESGCEVDPEYLKLWLSCLISKQTCIASLISWIIGFANYNSHNSHNYSHYNYSDYNENNYDLIENGLLVSLLKKVRPTSENNTLYEKFSIKII